ncbi:MAG: glycosyltransferase [Candidatus Marinimicrobia bacterium]|nr:glycosyltransferase [Candidatus Neomarinimicrobiota bacterium]
MVRVRYHGYLNREGIRGLLASCDAGLVLLHPTLNYRVALPVKMFEYMVSGLPFIASDFPQWEAIVREEDCGICVNPQDVGAIKKAIEYLYNNPDIAARMGNNGREAVLKKYHWEQEAKKLLSVYHGLLT